MNLKLITILLVLFYSTTSFSQGHTFKIYPALYGLQLDSFNEAKTRIHTLGAGVDVEHEVTGMRFVGSFASLSADKINEIHLTFGLAFRFHFYKDIFRVELLPPMFYMRPGVVYYARPFGIGIRVGKGRLQLNIKELIHNNTITSQIAIRYQIF